MPRLLPLALLLVWLPTAHAQPRADYDALLTAHRDSIHAAFLDPDTSPMVPAAIAGFSGLDYYDADPAYRVTARFRRSPAPEPVKMNTSDGMIRDYRRVGTLHFDLAGTPLVLSAYRSAAPPEDPADAVLLAVPFKDATNDTTTYAAGRYLDLPIPSGDTVVLDFNKAYAPYCAYSNRYSCILPPSENHLDVAVEAGVRRYETWHPVVSDERGFSAVFPGLPRDQDQPLGDGLTLQMKVYEEDGTAYMIMQTDMGANFDTLSADALAAFFDATQQRGAANVGGTILHSQSIELDGVPGRSFAFSAPERSLHGRWRLFASGGTLYQIAVVAEGGPPPGADADRFLDSFRLLDAGPTPRLQRLLRDGGFTYDVLDDGTYTLVFSTPDERTHLVAISTYAPDLTRRPSYEVWALVGQDLAAMPDGLAEAVLRLSGTLPALSAQLFGGEDGEPVVLALSVVLDQGVSAETLRRVMESLAWEADALEARYVGGDDL